MEHITVFFRVAAAGLCGLAAFLWGAPEAWILALLAFVVLDYISGLASAMVNERLSSKIGFKGIVRKTMFFATVAVGHIMDKLIGLNGVLRNAVIGFLIANEGLSILENAAACGIALPSKLIDALKQLQDKSK